MVSNIIIPPILGKIPILTDIFQMGWNHQLEHEVCVLRPTCLVLQRSLMNLKLTPSHLFSEDARFGWRFMVGPKTRGRCHFLLPSINRCLESCPGHTIGKWSEECQNAKVFSKEMIFDVFNVRVACIYIGLYIYIHMFIYYDTYTIHIHPSPE